MRGRVLGIRDGLLTISGDDGKRYEAAESELAAHERLAGTVVDFEPVESTAQKLFVIASSAQQKKAWLAALLAVFLGWIGVDRFYLGRPTEGALIAGAYIGGTLLLTAALSNDPYSISLMNLRGLIGSAFIVFGIIRAIIYFSVGQDSFSKSYGIRGAEGSNDA